MHASHVATLWTAPWGLGTDGRTGIGVLSVWVAVRSARPPPALCVACLGETGDARWSLGSGCSNGCGDTGDIRRNHGRSGITSRGSWSRDIEPAAAWMVHLVPHGYYLTRWSCHFLHPLLSPRARRRLNLGGLRRLETSQKTGETLLSHLIT